MELEQRSGTKPDELLLAQIEREKTAFHVAAQENHEEILQNLYVWAEEAQLCLDELKNKLFVPKDKYGYIAWHRSAENSSLEAFEIMDLCSGSGTKPR